MRGMNWTKAYLTVIGTIQEHSFITAKNVSTESKTEKLNVTYIQIQVMLKLNLLI